MQAVVFHGIGDIRLEEVADPTIRDPRDAVIRVTASAICGTDLHLVRGTLPGMKAGTILGHEAVGVVEEIGKGVRNLDVGDRVVVCSTIACGNCVYCRDGYYSQCNEANPNGPHAGTAFFGGPETTGPFDGLQAERARIPFANIGCLKLPEDVSDDSALLLSDIFPTGWMGAELAGVRAGSTVAVLGCGPVGQFAITAARFLGAARIFAIDTVPARLAIARQQGAETIDYEAEDPVEVIQELTEGIGVDCAIDAVGVDANRPHRGPAAKKLAKERAQLDKERKEIAPDAHPQDGQWEPGDAPSLALRWAVEMLAKAGRLGVIGVYSDSSRTFPVGVAMGKNLSIRFGNCDHRRLAPKLLDLVRSGQVLPEALITQVGPLTSAIDCYRAFDKRESDWVKVELQPALH